MITRTLKRILLCSAIGMFVFAAVALAAEYPQIRIKGTIKYIASEGTYGILSDEGKKYQPTRPLPKEYRKDGLSVVIDAKERKDIVGARMWGTAIEISTVSRAELYVSEEDKAAIRVLLLRMEAFNSRDLVKLQQVDSMSQSLTKDQLNSWLAGYGNYILHYVETVKVDGATINGFCLYSREWQNGIALSGNTQHSLMRFSLKNTAGRWMIAVTAAYRGSETIDLEQYITELKSKSKVKFGTENLARWKG